MKRGRGVRVAVALAVGLGAAARALPPSPFGINAHTPQGEALAPLLDAIAAAGIGWLRIDVSWRDIEAERGIDDWRRLDAVMVEARGRGLRILGILAYSPDWATDGPPGSGVPREVGDWRRFCAAAAARYAGLVDAWELWNEPNLRHFWGGSRGEWIEGILIPGAAAVRAGDPSALVAGPALAHVGGDGDWHGWLFDVLRRAGGELDVVTHHVYAGSDEEVSERLGSRTPFGDQPALWRLAAPSVREVLAAAGWAGPFWLTETGWQGVGATELFQAAKVRGLLDEWFTGRRGRGWIERVFFYELQDDAPTHWGILRSDLGRKPAWVVYRDFIAERRLAPAPTPVPRRPRIDKAPRREHPNAGS